MKVGARYYDPTIGRWIQKDPILDGFNWWIYCENDPVNGVDPSGQILTPGDYLIAIGFVGLGLSLIPTPISVPGVIISGAVIVGGAIWEKHEGEKFYRVLLELFFGIVSWIDIVKGWIGSDELKPRAPFLPKRILPPRPIYPPFYYPFQGVY